MKTMNEFLKEAEECVKEEGEVPTNTAGSAGESLKGDWKRYIKPILMRTAKRIKGRLYVGSN